MPAQFEVGDRVFFKEDDETTDRVELIVRHNHRIKGYLNDGFTVAAVRETRCTCHESDYHRLTCDLVSRPLYYIQIQVGQEVIKEYADFPESQDEWNAWWPYNLFEKKGTKDEMNEIP